MREEEERKRFVLYRDTLGSVIGRIIGEEGDNLLIEMYAMSLTSQEEGEKWERCNERQSRQYLRLIRAKELKFYDTFEKACEENFDAFL